jgi:phage gp46-like protein
MTPRPSVPAEYKGLHKYLRERFAQTVVLTFAEIEDLMGGTLPRVAREQRGWWTDAGGDGALQSRTWTAADRTAVPNFSARIVTFERLP